MSYTWDDELEIIMSTTCSSFFNEKNQLIVNGFSWCYVELSWMSNCRRIQCRCMSSCILVIHAFKHAGTTVIHDSWNRIISYRLSIFIAIPILSRAFPSFGASEIRVDRAIESKHVITWSPIAREPTINMRHVDMESIKRILVEWHFDLRALFASNVYVFNSQAVTIIGSKQIGFSRRCAEIITIVDTVNGKVASRTPKSRFTSQHFHSMLTKSGNKWSNQSINQPISRSGIGPGPFTPYPLFLKLLTLTPPYALRQGNT